MRVSKKHPYEHISPAWLGKHQTVAELDELLVERPDSKVFLAARLIALKLVNRRAAECREHVERVARKQQKDDRRAAERAERATRVARVQQKDAERARKRGEFKRLMADLQGTRAELERLTDEYSRASWWSKDRPTKDDIRPLLTEAREANNRAKAAWAAYCAKGA